MVAGLAIASLLFLTVAAVPAVETRFALAGRVVLYNRTKFLAAGIGMLLATTAVFFITRGP